MPPAVEMGPPRAVNEQSRAAATTEVAPVRTGSEAARAAGRGPSGAGEKQPRRAMKVILASRAASAPAWCGRSRSSSARCEKYGPPVYVRHEIVHNKHVVESLKAKGARFVEELSEVPPGAVTVFSAHGVAKSVEHEARDARAAGARRDLPAGHQGAQSGQALCRPGPHADSDRPCRPSRGRRHDGPDPGPGGAGAERKGRRRSSTSPADTPVAYVTQTTLSVDDTRASSPRCNADSATSSGRKPGTSATPHKIARRRCANFCKQVDVILVVGAKNSSNSNRLREIGAEAGVPSYLIADGSELAARMGRGRRGGGHHCRRLGAGSAGRGRDRCVAAARAGRSFALPGREETYRVPLPAELASDAEATRKSDSGYIGKDGKTMADSRFSRKCASAHISLKQKLRAANAIRWC